MTESAFRRPNANPEETGFYLLEKGTEAIAARIALAQAATQTLDLQYFLWHNDRIGKAIAYHILEAADRGVRVRFLLDDIGTKGLDENLALIDSHPNIEVRVFNAFGIRGFGRALDLMLSFSALNSRMHNKSFTADNAITVLGGRNLGDEYFALGHDFNFADVDVLAIGPLVKAVSDSYDSYWNSEWAKPMHLIDDISSDDPRYLTMRNSLRTFMDQAEQGEYVRAARESQLAKDITAGTLNLDWGIGKLMSDLPAKIGTASKNNDTYRFGPDLADELRKAESEILIINPYFIPGDAGVEFIENMEKKGVNVRIFTNSLASNNHPSVYGGYGKYRRDLLKTGAEIFEMNLNGFQAAFDGAAWIKDRTDAALHAKVFVVDGKRSFIGSLNLDPRSVYTNTEIGALIDSPAIATRLGEIFELLIQPENAYRVHFSNEAEMKGRLTWTGTQKGQLVQFHKEPDSSVRMRLVAFIARILPVEGLL